MQLLTRNVLKSKGKFVTWELAFSDKTAQKIFQDIIRKKDEIAGFTKLVANRWFPAETEIMDSFQQARFVNCSSPHDVEPTVNLRKREKEVVSIERSKNNDRTPKKGYNKALNR